MKSLLQHLALLVAGALLAGIVLLITLDSVVMPRVVDVPLVTVPRLSGKPVSAARDNLARWGMTLAVRDSLHHDTVPAGAVVGQDPVPGRQIKRGRRIRVDVSLGPRYYQVPEAVQGVGLRGARLQLEENHLVLGEVLYVSSSTVPRDVVIRSTPPVGTPLPRGTPVDLEVSSGSPDLPKTVPSVLGLPVEQVSDSLRKYEMRLGGIGTRVDRSKPEGIVLTQSPQAGERVARLTPVQITISAASAENPVLLAPLPEE